MLKFISSLQELLTESAKNKIQDDLIQPDDVHRPGSPLSKEISKLPASIHNSRNRMQLSPIHKVLITAYAIRITAL